ncbi:MAG: hypothetical protein ACE5PT_10465 [Gemmatimonadales bacterium]
MAPELGGSQISQLLESVPGIASVLRSPVADALVSMIRAGAGLERFSLRDADELVQYSVRRGLISAHEGERLLAEVTVAAGRRRGRKEGGRAARGGRGGDGGRARKRAKPAKKPATAARKKRSPSKPAARKKAKGRSPRRAVKKRVKRR